jgi:hypothetical protein
MNERIKELLYKAGGEYGGEYPTTGQTVIYTDGVDCEKFAELIVLECMKVVSDGKYSVDECRYNSHRYAHNDARCEASLDIKKHFGV